MKKLKKINATNLSLEITREISERINNQTFHHHYHVLFDIANTYPDSYPLEYLEIGCYAGGSACLMLQRKNTSVTSIDLGVPINPDIVQENVKMLNHHNNPYTYIKGDSKSDAVYSQVSNRKYDIIFIDGDHSYSGVISDFQKYSELVKKNGYIVFDDYNDSKHSPQVKMAVDDILSNLEGYLIIGTLPNLFGARPDTLKDGNDFIIQKL